MKKLLSFLLMALMAGSVNAQENKKLNALTQDQIKEIQGSFVKDAATTAIQNILIQDKDIKSKALNHNIQDKIDHHFKYRVDVKGITDQKSSGRCWMFTSMNVLRPGVMKKYNLSSFDFSHNYNYFWDIFEKSNLFLENIIATAKKDIDDREVVTYLLNPVSDGGVWNLFYNIAEKYGVVPADVMPETEHSNNTNQMVSFINERLRGAAYNIRELSANKGKAADIQKEKMDALKDVYRILSLCLGEPPVEFTWKYTNKDGALESVKSTPKEFYASIIPDNYDPKTLIMIMNDPTREYYKVYDIANYRNTAEGIDWVYLNLPNDEIKKAAVESIKNNEAMYASCDVGKQHNRKTGILDPKMYDYESLLGVKFGMDKKARILMRQSGSSHAMTIVGVDVDENGDPVKWEFENSWGSASGHNGYLTFTDDWFNEYMFRIVINRKYLSSKAIKALDEKPVYLPVWDYMF